MTEASLEEIMELFAGGAIIKELPRLNLGRAMSNTKLTLDMEKTNYAKKIFKVYNMGVRLFEVRLYYSADDVHSSIYNFFKR